MSRFYGSVCIYFIYRYSKISTYLFVSGSSCSPYIASFIVFQSNVLLLRNHLLMLRVEHRLLCTHKINTLLGQLLAVSIATLPHESFGFTGDGVFTLGCDRFPAAAAAGTVRLGIAHHGSPALVPLICMIIHR